MSNLFLGIHNACLMGGRQLIEPPGDELFWHVNTPCPLPKLKGPGAIRAGVVEDVGYLDGTLVVAGLEIVPAQDRMLAEQINAVRGHCCFRSRPLHTGGVVA